MDDLRMNVDDVVEDKLSYYQETVTKTYKDGEQVDEKVSKIWYDYKGEDNLNYRADLFLDNGDRYEENVLNGVNTVYYRPLNRAVVFDTNKEIKSILPAAQDGIEQMKQNIREYSIKRNMSKFLDFKSEKYDLEIVGNKKVMNRDAVGLKMTPNKNTVKTDETILWIDTETRIVLSGETKDGDIKTITETTILNLEPNFRDEDFIFEMPDNVEIQNLNENPI